MAHIASTQEYLDKLLSLPRPGEENVFAFYDHRLEMVCTNPRLMLIPLDDHLVHRGDGIFETVKYIGRRIYQLDAHLERMQQNCRALSLPAPMPWEDIRTLAVETARAGEQEDGYLSLFIGRGPGGFAVDLRECPQPSLYLVARRFKHLPESYWQEGVFACRAEQPAKPSHMAKLKSVNYLPNVLMKKEAVDRGCDFVLCFDQEGYLAEGCIENVILVDSQGQIVVPELRNALSGTTLMRALELIQGEREHIFRPVREEEIYQAREVILLGTTLDALSVVRYNGRPINDGYPGPVSKRLRELLIRDLQENGVSF